MSGSPARRPCVEDLVSTYRADLVAAGMFAGHPVTSVARMFFTRVGAAGIHVGRRGGSVDLAPKVH